MGAERAEMPFVRIPGKEQDGLRPVGYAVVLDGHGGLGADRQKLYDHNPEVREVYDIFSEVAGFDIAELSFNGTKEEINRTENHQLLVGASNEGALRMLYKVHPRLFQKPPRLLMAQSMGLVSAIEKAGYFGEPGSPESLARLAKTLQVRGKIMQRASDENPGGIVRIVVSNGKGKKVSDEQLQLFDIVKHHALEEGLFEAIEVSDRQTMLAGLDSQLEGLHKHLEGFKQFGIHGFESPIKGPFHSPHMSGTIDEFKPFLDSMLEDPSNPIPVLANTTDPITVMTGREQILQEVGEDLFVKSVRGPAMVDFRSNQRYAGTYLVGDRKVMGEAIVDDKRFTVPRQLTSGKAVSVATGVVGVAGTVGVIGYAVYKHHAGRKESSE